ncbi:MAG: hypothetical protein RL480_2351 [Pseudomonadota bacterium]|jgi:uncharacterized protein (DUF2141 family)
MAKSRMRAISVVGAILLPPLAAPALAQGPVVLGDTAACRPGADGSAALVTVHGFKDRSGQLRIQNYTGAKDEFLASGKYLRRHDVPMSAGGDMTVCLTLPGPGRYAIVALHDRNTDGKLSVWSDGIGLSANPRLKLAKPNPEETLVSFGAGVTPLRIIMNYRRGLSVKPLD